MFTKILIANRGEIACRVIKTARRMGIDGRRLFRCRSRRAACRDGRRGRAYRPAAAGESYLVIEKIIAACKADRRPGRPSRLRLPLRARGFPSAKRWKGRHRLHRPNPGAIGRWATRSNRRNSPTPPRSRPCRAISASSRTPKHAVKIADEIGYPVMIKASAGGGGKGMRIAIGAGEVARRLRPRQAPRRRAPSATTASSSKNSSSIPATSRSRCWRQARQRHLSRRARMLDPAPQPEGRRGGAVAFPRRGHRAAMGEQAVALAKAVDYERRHRRVRRRPGQELLLPRNEHPPAGRASRDRTVTGIDLVEQMIRVAAGEKLQASPSRRQAERLGRRAASMPKTPTATSCPRSAAS
jgi:propionyl-CoA carboxylase alpha chain